MSSKKMVLWLVRVIILTLIVWYFIIPESFNYIFSPIFEIVEKFNIDISFPSE